MQWHRLVAIQWRQIWRNKNCFQFSKWKVNMWRVSRYCSAVCVSYSLKSSIHVKGERLYGDNGVRFLECSQEKNAEIKCPYGNYNFGNGDAHSICTTNIHIVKAHKTEFEIHVIPVKPSMRITFGSGETIIYYQCGVCGAFTTVRYARHYEQHFSKNVNAKIADILFE